MSSIAQLTVNGYKVTMVKSGHLKKPDGSRAFGWYFKNPIGPEQISVSPEVWDYLVAKNIHRDVIAIELYTGTIMYYLAVYVVLENIPRNKSDDILKLFESPEKEGLIRKCFEKGEVVQSDINLLIRMCRLEEAAKAIEKWKQESYKLQNTNLSGRVIDIFGKFSQKFKEYPMNSSVFVDVKNKQIAFFKAIESTLHGKIAF